MTYELITQEDGSQIVKRTNPDETVTWIPTVVGNSDYQAYLTSLQSGN